MGDEENRVKRYVNRLQEIEGKGDYEEAAGYLDKLDHMDITAPVIFKTRIGFRVNAIRRKSRSKGHQNVSSRARRLIKKWQAIVIKHHNQKKVQNDPKPSTSGQKSPDESDSEIEEIRPAPKPQVNLSNKKPGPKSKTVKRSISVDSDKGDFREKWVGRLFESLKLENEGLDMSTLKRIARRIEQEIYSEFGDTDIKYTRKAQSRVWNLNNNTELRERVIVGDITPEQFCQMKAEEMANDKIKELDKKARDKSIKSLILEDNPDNLTCPQCKATFSREGEILVTSMNSCIKCGHMWRKDE